MHHTLHKHVNVVCWERARQDGSNSHLLMSRCCFREAASRPCRAARTPPPALCALCAAADVTAEPRCADAFSATSAAQRGSSCTKNWCQQSCDTPTPCQLDEGCAPTARSVWPPLQQPGKPQPDGLIKRQTHLADEKQRGGCQQQSESGSPCGPVLTHLSLPFHLTRRVIS